MGFFASNRVNMGGSDHSNWQVLQRDASTALVASSGDGFARKPSWRFYVTRLRANNRGFPDIEHRDCTVKGQILAYYCVGNPNTTKARGAEGETLCAPVQKDY